MGHISDRADRFVKGLLQRDLPPEPTQEPYPTPQRKLFRRLASRRQRQLDERRKL